MQTAAPATDARSTGNVRERASRLARAASRGWLTSRWCTPLRSSGLPPCRFPTPRRRKLGPLAAVLAVAGGLLFAAPPALAAPPETPETVKPAQATATTVLLRGVLNPNAKAPGEAGHYEFLYKASNTECNGGGKAPAPPGTALGFEHEEVPAQEVTGLTPHTEYAVCLLARNLKGEETVGLPATFTTALPPETPEGEEAVEVEATSARVRGVLNPKAKGEAGSYEFLYRVSATECEGESGAPEPAGPALGSKEEAVEATVTKLLPNTEYSFCLLARNAAGETAVGPPVSFTTVTEPPTIEAESFSSVFSHSATLSASVNPRGSATEYHFEYGTSTAYGTSTPATSIGAGQEAVLVQSQLSDALQPETTYHFRVVAVNAGNETTRGGDMSFATFPLGGSGLPDRRSYELVSSLTNGDASVYDPVDVNVGASNDSSPLPFQASPDGGGVAFVAGSPIAGGNGNDGRGKGNEYLARRSAGSGWSAVPIQPAGLNAPTYQAFSSDLSVGILQSNEVLSAGAPGGGYDVLYSGSTSAGSFTPLFTTIPTHRTAFEFEASNVPMPEGGENRLAYAGASSDMTHLLFEANDALTAGAVDGGKEANNLYESVGGQLRLVNVLPGGASDANATFGSLEHGQPDFSHVISDDGSRIFWTDLNTHGLYVRENGMSTVQVDASQGAGSGGGGKFWTATRDGSRVFFTDESRLTGDSTAAAGAPDLYQYDVQSGHLTDLSVDANAGEHANVQGVLGVSEDGAYVYFVAGGVLAGNAAPQTCVESEGIQSDSENGNKCNLYVIHQGEAPKLIAVPASLDGKLSQFIGSGLFGDWQSDVGHRTAQVTPDGRHLMFASTQNLTGYEGNGKPEIFVYDFGSAGVSCVSCNPSGAPATIGAGLPVSHSNTYALRTLSADGNRVFFGSYEALVPQDMNGQADVYEWERDGSGSCGREKGCLYLLSSGTSPDASFFLDASTSGEDVFIIARAQLTPQDQNEVFDVYDARANAPGALASPVCTGIGCQGVPPAPPIFATPSSVTFNGVGNFAAPAKTVVKPKKKAKKKARKRSKLKKTKRRAKSRMGAMKPVRTAVRGRAGRS
jgi:hypothetical protein